MRQSLAGRCAAHVRSARRVASCDINVSSRRGDTESILAEHQADVSTYSRYAIECVVLVLSSGLFVEYGTAAELVPVSGTCSVSDTRGIAHNLISQKRSRHTAPRGCGRSTTCTTCLSQIRNFAKLSMTSFSLRGSDEIYAQCTLIILSAIISTSQIRKRL